MNLAQLPEDISQPLKRTVKKAACGDKHAFILLDNGVVLISGVNDIG